MQTIQVNSFGYKLNYNVPAAIEEFDALAKRVGAALDEANKNVIYRSVLNRFRDGYLHGIEASEATETEPARAAILGLDKQTGIERKFRITKPEVRDGDKITQEEVTAWDEKEEAFKDRVFAQLVSDGKFASVEAAEAAYEPHAQAVLDAIDFDPSKTDKASAGPKKTPKTYYGIADALVEMAGSVDAAIAKFESKTGRTLAARDRDGLAKAIWEDQAAQRKNIAAAYAG